jgi:hypothetical protein
MSGDIRKKKKKKKRRRKTAIRIVSNMAML